MTINKSQYQSTRMENPVTDLTAKPGKRVVVLKLKTTMKHEDGSMYKSGEIEVRSLNC